jgi:6-phosphogluconolactonase
MIRSAPRSSWQQTISALPADFTGTNTAAEIRVHPSGRFLYTTNRGHNSVAMFEIEPETGELEVIGWESTRGEWPRGMNIDPSGTFLYAASAKSSLEQARSWVGRSTRRPGGGCD